MREPINHSNYEAWLLDYIEGNLSDHDEDILLEYLKQHPELCAEIDDLKPATLTPPANSGYRAKNSLKKGSSHDETLIALTEGLLSEPEKNEAQALLTDNQEAAELFGIYAQCKLRDDGSEYPFKNQLKKNRIPMPLLLSAAAAVVFLVVSFSLSGIFDLQENRFNASQQMLASANSPANVRVVTLVNHTINHAVQSFGTQQTAPASTNTNLQNREYLANIPAHHIQPQITTTAIAEPAMSYQELTLHEVAEYKGSRFSGFSLRNSDGDFFGSGSLSSLAENMNLESPIKLLRKTKEDILSQDLLAEIRNLKN